MRCFYPLSGVNRLSMDRTFRSEAPGFGLIDIFKSLKGYTHQSKLTLIKMTTFLKSHSSADPGKGLANAPCVTGNTVKDPANGVHQTTAAGFGPRPSYLRYLHRQEVSSPNHSSRQASAFGTHQVGSEASFHPGLYSFQSQDTSVASLSTSDYSHSVPPGYDQLVDISLQLSNLSTQSCNIVFRGENLDLTDATQASNPASKVHRHPVIEQLETDSEQSKMSTRLGPNGLVKNIWHAGLGNQPSVSLVHKPHQGRQGQRFDIGMKTQNLQKRLGMELSLFGSPEGGSRLNSEVTRGVLPLFPSQGQHSSGQCGKQERDPPAQNKPEALHSKMDPLRPVGIEQWSSARSQSEENLERSGSPELRNTDALNSKVHNVRVKPPSRFVSSANLLRQKPSIQPLKSGPTVSSSQEHVADQGPSSTHLSPNQRKQLHNPIHPTPNYLVAVRGDGGSLGSAFARAAGKIGTALL